MSLVVSIVGRSHSGKTTLLEKLIPELKRRGYSVAAVKHTSSSFQLDHPGKDSWRLAAAGSDAVVLVSPEELALLRKISHNFSLAEIVELIGDEYDFILVEGFKGGDTPKIEVHRKEMGGLMTPPDMLLAVVTDEKLDLSVPQFSSSDGVALVDLLEERLAVNAEVGMASHPMVDVFRCPP